MPCDTVTTNVLDLGKVDVSTMVQALVDVKADNIVNHGWGLTFTLNNVYGYLRDGKLETLGDVETMSSTLKQAYSKRVVMNAAAKFGWQAAKVGDKIRLNRRG